MTAISRASIRSTVRNRGDYSNTRRFSNDYLNEEIQKAFAKFWQLVADVNEGWWDVEAPVVTTNAQAYVSLPVDCWRVRAIDRLDGDDHIEMPQIALGERNRYGSTTGEPLSYRLSARGAELYPTPNGPYTLRLIYTPSAPALDENTPREWYNGWEDYVIEETLFQLDKREGRPLGDRLATLEIVVKRVREGVAQRRSQEPEYLTLREYNDTDPYDDGILG